MTIEGMRDSSGLFQKLIPGYTAPRSAGEGTGFDWLDEFGQFAGGRLSQTRSKARETNLAGRAVLPGSTPRVEGTSSPARHSASGAVKRFFPNRLQVQQRNLNALGVPDVEMNTYYTEDFRFIDARRPCSQFVFSQLAVSPHNVLKRVMTIETGRTVTITAIALKRYRLQQGNSPVTLDALVPKFLAAVPRDPVDGQPLRYRVDRDGTFLLYSIGEDGVDNEGDPQPVDSKGSTFAWQRGRDWVWPKPASPAEVEDYFRVPAQEASDARGATRGGTYQRGGGQH